MVEHAAQPGNSTSSTQTGKAAQPGAGPAGKVTPQIRPVPPVPLEGKTLTVVHPSPAGAAGRPVGPPPPRHIAASQPQAAPVLRAPVAKPEPEPRPAAPAMPAARASHMRPRHLGLAISFLVLVLLPIVIASSYLYLRASDQYASTVGFSVHREGANSSLSLLSGLSSISGSSSADTDIIYNYLNSQQLVKEIDAELDLRSIWATPESDPVFGFDPSGTIEDLTKYWGSMVDVYYDSTTRLIEVRVLAFSAEDAQRVTEAIFARSAAMINKLNAVAVEDSVRYAREELDKARVELTAIREEMTEFRNKQQFVDPSADLATQSTILASLQQEMASALIELDLLRDNGTPNDPRIDPLERRIRVIEERIKTERAKLGVGGATDDGKAYADVVAEYERLAVDRQFAEGAYQAARTAYDLAQAEAHRQSRYLAAYLTPTLAESSRFPERGTLVAILAVFLFMAWGIGVLIYYSLRDRR